MKVYLPVIALVLAAACNRNETSAPAPVTPPAAAGDSSHGKQLIEQYGCTICHIVPGLEGPKGMVGPSLEHVASRQVIAQNVPNTPQNVTAYIQNPQASNPQNTMPNLGVKPEEARDIAAYLSTLR